jgi:hypothetical protein
MVAFLARAILGIPSNHIGIECVFSIARIVTCLCQCHLVAKNLDLLISLNKNWPDDPCVGLEDMGKFEELEEGLLDVLAFEFPEAIECHIKECQEDWETFA